MGKKNQSLIRNTCSWAAALLLVGCVADTPSVPAGYAGPVANIKDSVTWQTGTSGDFFFVLDIDGKKIKNLLEFTTGASQGQGLTMYGYDVERDIPARPCILTIVGRRHYAAPILELTHAIYQVSGQIKFDPQPKGEYEVMGELGEDYSAVWIEDRATHKPVGPKIEIKGPARLGVFEK